MFAAHCRLSKLFSKVLGLCGSRDADLARATDLAWQLQGLRGELLARCGTTACNVLRQNGLRFVLSIIPGLRGDAGKGTSTPSPLYGAYIRMWVHPHWLASTQILRLSKAVVSALNRYHAAFHRD